MGGTLFGRASPSKYLMDDEQIIGTIMAFILVGGLVTGFWLGFTAPRAHTPADSWKIYLESKDSEYERHLSAMGEGK